MWATYGEDSVKAGTDRCQACEPMQELSGSGKEEKEECGRLSNSRAQG